MQHGLIDSGGTWFFNPKKISIPFQFVDRGYDVWVTNSRGSLHSNQHVNYTDKDKKFWEFTVDQMIEYDVPANLNYILNHTKASKVIYMGHS